MGNRCVPADVFRQKSAGKKKPGQKAGLKNTTIWGRDGVCRND
jgi:hypothetical protein